MDVLRRVRHTIASDLGAQAFLVAVSTYVVYFLTRYADNPYNQYVLLADAFLDGRLHLVDPPPFLEIARFGERAFVIDPPAPTLFLLPFVAIFGTGANHVLVSCGVGACTAALVWIAARRLWDDVGIAVAMTVLVAFGTNHWWLASDGGFWSFAHVAAVFFLAAALVESAGRKRAWLVGALVGLAGLSRLPTFLVFPVFAYLVLDGDIKITRRNIERIFPFGIALAFAAMVYLTYNFARYGTVFDRGYYHPQYVGEPWFAEGRFDVTYIPRHLRAMFIDLPVFRAEFPFAFPKTTGTALILTTPALVYAVRARLNARNVAALLTLLLVAVPLVTHGATGWSQFGYRFALDALPAWLLLVASGMRERVTKLSAAAIGIGVLVNLWGTLAFNRFDWVA